MGFGLRAVGGAGINARLVGAANVMRHAIPLVSGSSLTARAP
ncbi:HU family DNA-binding protein, partial [Xanthomonas perforans]